MKGLAITIEEHEQVFWGKPPQNATKLVIRVYELRRKPINQFEIEDLRILINQDEAFGLLIPIALEKLKENLFSEGDLYPGDLLNSVLTSKKDFWISNPTLKMEMIGTYEAQISLSWGDEMGEGSIKRIRKLFDVFVG